MSSHGKILLGIFISSTGKSLGSSTNKVLNTVLPGIRVPEVTQNFFKTLSVAVLAYGFQWIVVKLLAPAALIASTGPVAGGIILGVAAILLLAFLYYGIIKPTYLHYNNYILRLNMFSEAHDRYLRSLKPDWVNLTKPEHQAHKQIIRQNKKDWSKIQKHIHKYITKFETIQFNPKAIESEKQKHQTQNEFVGTLLQKEILTQKDIDNYQQHYQKLSPADNRFILKLIASAEGRTDMPHWWIANTLNPNQEINTAARIQHLLATGKASELQKTYQISDTDLYLAIDLSSRENRLLQGGILMNGDPVTAEDATNIATAQLKGAIDINIGQAAILQKLLSQKLPSNEALLRKGVTDFPSANSAVPAKADDTPPRQPRNTNQPSLDEKAALGLSADHPK